MVAQVRNNESNVAKQEQEARILIPVATADDMEEKEAEAENEEEANRERQACADLMAARAEKQRILNGKKRLLTPA